MNVPSPQANRWLLDDIVHLVLDSDDHWWPKDLARLAQVSPAWLNPVRRRLYASPALRSFHACSQLALTLVNHPSLLPLVKSIDLSPITAPTNINGNSGARSLLMLEGLQSITLGGYMAVGASQFLHILADPSAVKNLHIDGSIMTNSLIHRPSLEWDDSLALKFQSLRTLRLTNIELDIIYPSAPYQLPICELFLDNIIVTGGFISHLLSQTPSLERLCFVSKDITDFDEQIRPLLATCDVQVLEFEIQADYVSQIVMFSHDSHLPSLRCLRLDGVNLDYEALHSISQSCRNIEKLLIQGRMVGVEPSDWVRFITSGSLPRLNCLGVPWGTNQPPFSKWDERVAHGIVEVAASCNISILHTKGPPS